MQGLSAACLHVCNVGGVYWVGFYYCDASQNGRKASISCNSTGVAKTQLGCGLCSCFVVDRYIQTKKYYCTLYGVSLDTFGPRSQTIAIDARFLLVFLPTLHINLFLHVSFYERQFSHHTAAFFYAHYDDQYVYHEG